MKKPDFAKLASSFGKLAYLLRKHSPKIMVVGGVIGTVASTVIACKETMKLPEILDDAKDRLDVVHDEVKYGEDPDKAKKQLTIIYLKTGAKLVKLYLPAVGLGVLSIASILTSHGVMGKRNAALATAYAALESSYKEYRARLVERYGEEADKSLLYNSHIEKIDKTITDENGKTKKIKEAVTVTDVDKDNYNVFYFDPECSEAATGQRDYDLLFLKAQQEIANHLFQVNKFMLFGDVLNQLGIKRSVPSLETGWVYDESKVDVDNYINFHIQETYRMDAAGNVMPTILLDFNVEGSVWTRAKEKGLLTA